MAYVEGRTDGRRSGGRHGPKAASADRLRDGIVGSGGGGQTEIAMSRQGRGLEDGQTGGRVQAILPQSGVTACVKNGSNDAFTW